MNSHIIYHYLAIKDLHDSMNFYEDQESGLGFKFERSVKQKIITIQKYPERFAIRKAHYRQTLVKNFPYIIVYRYNKLKQQITIVSIFHTSRNPKYKYRK